MNKPVNGNGGGGKSFLTIGALGSALCGGLCLGIFLGLNAATKWFDTSIGEFQKANESQASMAKSMETMATTFSRMEARGGRVEAAGQ